MKLFSLTLQTVDDGAYRRLRNALKTLLRRDKLRCVDAKEIHDSNIQKLPASLRQGAGRMQAEKER